jgi:hypothetical protein
VAMYELPLVVFAAINLGLILAVHVRLGALETDPVTNVGVGGRIESFEKSSQLAWKPHQVSPNRWRSTVPLSFCLQPPSQRGRVLRQIRRYSDAEPGRTAHRTARSLAPVAQRIEQQPSNLSVVGSSPTGGAKHSFD